MVNKKSDRLRLESALDLQRRLPPNRIESHVSKMIDLVSFTCILHLHYKYTYIRFTYMLHVWETYVILCATCKFNVRFNSKADCI